MSIRMKYLIVGMALLTLASAGCKRTTTPFEDPTENIDDPEVKRFVYTSDLNGNFDIWKRIDDDATQLTKDESYDHWWPRTAARTNRILFYRSEASRGLNDYTAAALCTMNASGGNIEEIIKPNAYGWTQQGLATWSNLGNQIVMAAVDSSVQTWQLYVTDELGQNPVRISLRDEADYLDPVFSSDNQSVFCSVIPEGMSVEDKHYEIVEIDLQSGEEIRITFNEVRDQHPCISSDGKTLIYESLVDPEYLTIGKWSLVEYDFATMKETTLLEDEHINLFPRYAKNGIDVYYTRLDIQTFTMSIVKHVRSSGSSVSLLKEQQQSLNVDPY